MVSKSLKLPLLVIVGPTASGKTSLAIEIAKKFNGEIICADSRSVYKGTNIGTAKPSIKDQNIVPHWGLDLVDPGSYYSVSDYKFYADQKISEIRSRGRIPILVGGTGLYIDAILFDYKFGLPADIRLRTKLQQLSLDKLYEYCIKNKIALPNNYKNKRYVIRSIERNGTIPQKNDKPQNNCIIVGITTENACLKGKIIDRINQMFKDGVLEEAKQLGRNFGWDNEAMKSNIYPLIHRYLQGEMDLDEVKSKAVSLDLHLAKRQLTWLRRNIFIQWFSFTNAKKFLHHELANRT